MIRRTRRSFPSLGLLLAGLLLGLPAGAADRERPPDALGAALSRMNVGVADLGYRPKATWGRYPHPRTIPYLLPFFEDLLAHPLDTYEFTRTMGNAVEDLLTPEKLREEPRALYRLAVLLGTDRLLGGFRGYGANLDPRPAEHDPLLHALVRLLDRSHTRFRRDVTFGQPADGSGDPLEKLRKDLAKIPPALHLPLAKLVLNLIDAREWIDLGLRRVPPELRRRVFEALPDLAESTGDATRYFPALDDAARLLDAPSLYYGCLKALQAVQDARRELAAAFAALEHRPRFDLVLSTSWGAVHLDASSADTPVVEDPLLVVGFPGADVLDPSPGATDVRRPLSVALFLDAHAAPGGDRRVASGILGCGLVYSAGRRDDAWSSADWGLGTGLFGMGVLVDEGGDDRYRMAEAGMGTGYLGAGLLLDAAGNDRYHLEKGDGQGLGFPGGVGILADRSGNDSYYAEPDAAKAGRADYHSRKKVAVSNAQGAGSGRRGDGADGHCRAGGLGALLDVDGDDAYRAGNFSQGLGYWYGTGLLWDGGGNDEYRSVYFTQGSGAHFAVGALIDEGGDDRHVLEENAGAAFAFGWDVVAALLIDRGAGNDVYEAKVISTGLAEVRSNALFLDEGGDDTYILGAGQRGLGDVDDRPGYTAIGRTATYPFHLTQVAIFLDLGGKDRYLRRDRKGKLAADPEAGDGTTWHLRRRDPAAANGPNVSIAMDLQGGRAAFLDPWPPRGAGSREGPEEGRGK